VVLAPVRRRRDQMKMRMHEPSQMALRCLQRTWKSKSVLIILSFCMVGSLLVAKYSVSPSSVGAVPERAYRTISGGLA
jgi:hypothetical protein